MFAQHPGNQGKEGGVDGEEEKVKGREEEEERISHCSKVSLGFLWYHSAPTLWVQDMGKINTTIIITVF